VEVGRFDVGGKSEADPIAAIAIAGGGAEAVIHADRVAGIEFALRISSALRLPVVAQGRLQRMGAVQEISATQGCSVCGPTLGRVLQVLGMRGERFGTQSQLLRTGLDGDARRARRNEIPLFVILE